MTIICFQDQNCAEVFEIQREKEVSKPILHQKQSSWSEHQALESQVAIQTGKSEALSPPSLLTVAHFCRHRCCCCPLRRHWAQVTRSDYSNQPRHSIALSHQFAERSLLFLHIAVQRQAEALSMAVLTAYWFFVRILASKIQWISMWTCNLTLNIIEATR